MTTEDFSFPTENFPSSKIDSPPLWHSSPVSSGVNSHQELTSKDDEKRSIRIGKKPANFNQRRSLSCVDHGRKMAKRPGEKEGITDQEEKMDLLWEDFNEELNLGSRVDSDKCSGDHQMADFGCVKGLKLSRTRNNNKPSMIIVLKMLKKLFLLENISPTNNHHHYHSKLKTSRPW
ncbi:hypothetical protein TIFTF001_029718 [Ficus carica]|uniref:Uncharacterized protein n=1 Tax=Ficus carica TaxID=3494 RepID=A0AA88DWD0_FICCA|nr:hypothetical protein TIFTF001_029718 [Ficus carica]